MYILLAITATIICFALGSSNRKLKDEVSRLTKENKTEKTSHQQSIQKLEDEVLTLTQKIKTNEMRHHQSINELNTQHSERISIIKKRHETMLSQEKADHNSALLQKTLPLYQRINELEEKCNHLHAAFTTMNSNLSAIPYMAGMMAEIETYGLENLALGLSWGSSQKRLEKVKAIREIRKDAKLMVERNKDAQYKLAYLLELFPNLSDVIECEFSELPIVEVSELSDRDYVRDYLSNEEYSSLSTVQRNQLALDRYQASHKKTKWQIGRDYEQYVCYRYRQQGYDVDDFGSYMGLEDLGRDIIIKKGIETRIIQCKYWSSVKQIHEKHITQLFGTITCYCIENNKPFEQVKGVLITNITLSEMAKKMAHQLGILYIENYSMGNYPCIKCNIGHDEFGETKIYHLPFDQLYDSTKIKNKGEFYAMTVAEAEAAGFRRTHKWFGNK